MKFNVTLNDGRVISNYQVTPHWLLRNRAVLMTLMHSSMVNAERLLMRSFPFKTCR